VRCPTLAELPPPPPRRTGWPWTVETPPLPSARPDGSPWPRISIVTPSYNQGRFIEETIRSVLLQGYPDLEYIIIDGASTDQSAEIIQKYEPWLTYWVSEKDRGQAHAINKGFAKATGDIGAYLNSDDMYLVNALTIASNLFIQFHYDLLIGRQARPTYKPKWRLLRRSWWKHFLNWLPPLYLVGEKCTIAQESSFWRLARYRLFQFDETLHVLLDSEWYYRTTPGARVLLTSRRTGFYRHHADTKTATLQHVGHQESLRLEEHHKALRPVFNECRVIRRSLMFKMPFIVAKSILPWVNNYYLYIHPPVRR